MSIPIKTIEEIKSKNTTNRAYLFIDASDNILKMKINNKFCVFGSTEIEPDTPGTTGKPDLIASGFSETDYSFNSLIPTNKFNGTWIYTPQDNGEDVWVHESGEYKLCLPSYSGAYGYPVWHVFLVDGTSAGEFWEMDPDHDSAYSSPVEVKQWNSQLANLTGKFEEKTSNENGSEPETPNYGEGALRVSGFTDLNDEMMGLSYPFSNFNGIYRKNSDASYEKIYDLNNNPVSTPYFILMDTTNGYWYLSETSTISHYHNSIAYHDGDEGVMPPTAANGITWFYSGQYDKTLRNFTIEEI